MFLRRIVLLLGLLAVAAACGEAASGQGVSPPATAAVGGLPTQAVTTQTLAESTSTVVRTTVTVAPNEQIGARVPGNRVILIGDSVLAGTSRRYGGEMCAALVPLGWQTEVDAETGRFIDFGDRVLDSRLAAGWDVSVIFLGNNYGDNQDVYRRYLDAMVARLSPQPVVLLTVSEFKPSRAQVNAVVFEMAQKYPNVVVLDWAAVTGADRALTGDDGLHLTDAGRASLAEQVALILGPAAVPPGKCLSTGFSNDSSGPVGGPPTTVKKSTTPKTTTTVASSASTTPRTTVPATTPVTSSPATNPPTTVPATTSPPANDPPSTVTVPPSTG